MENQTKPAAAVNNSSNAASDLKNHGSIREYCTKNGLIPKVGIEKAKLSGLPVMRFKRKDGKPFVDEATGNSTEITGIVLSRRAGEAHPIDSDLTPRDFENLYVQEGIGESGQMRLIITTGGGKAWHEGF